ncbi:hypothetical protein WA026_014827 [Henosepilachna vigintioctopunctata]
MQSYGQVLTCRRIFVVSTFCVAVIILFIYSVNTLNSSYYDDEFFEVWNISDNITDNDDKKLEKDFVKHTQIVTSLEFNRTHSNLDIPQNYDFEIVQTEKPYGDEITTLLPPSNESNENLTIISVSSSTTTESENVRLPSTSSTKITTNFEKEIISKDYLVWSQKCKIPNFDPFSKDAMKYHQKENYISCNKHKKLLSYVNVTDNKATLYIDETVLPDYTKAEVHCCYSYVTRHGSKNKPDVGIKLGQCTPFRNSVILLEGTVKVSCKTNDKKTIYQNVHEVILVKKSWIKSENLLNSKDAPSILFIGIDSISRLNLIRTMPNTYEFLTNRSDVWFPLYGYNKIGDNTFPNLMAILTGYNETEAYKICNPKTIGPLDSCRFIFKTFKKFGYITAYGEDESCINTFNYRKKGFVKEPVDYYFKPYMEASESLGKVLRDSLSYCAGPETSGERIMNLAKNFAITYKNYSTFGFFWMNTFSHNNINAPNRMDKNVHSLLDKLTRAGILDNSIVIFLSDHGIRFGEIRHTFTGWLEERLPFIFFSFPGWFKKKYPQEIANFQTNSNRLTTPYDLYMTLQHILVLTGFNYTIQTIDTCPSCKSLFTEIDLNRSCETSGITAHWCTCGGYNKVDKKEQIVVKAAHFLIEEVHKIVSNKNGLKKCSRYNLSKILTSYKSDHFSYKNDTYLLIAVETTPKAVFESTLHLKIDAKNNTVFSIESSISRLDSYGPHSKCVEDEKLKQYCFCK